MKNNKIKVKDIKKFGQNWRWLKKDDIMYEAEDIIKILTPPNTVDSRGYFIISEIFDFIWK